jgi:hypothetical protein
MKVPRHDTRARLTWCFPSPGTRYVSQAQRLHVLLDTLEHAKAQTVIQVLSSL